MDCKAPCCVHNQDVQIKRDRVSLPEEKTMASKRLNEINMCLPTGIDLPTHIKCTSCGKFVCPSCFGLCPVFPCHERTCLVSFIPRFVSVVRPLTGLAEMQFEGAERLRIPRSTGRGIQRTLRIAMTGLDIIHLHRNLFASLATSTVWVGGQR